MQRMTSTPWFRRRRIGFGWSPVSWQGWLVTVVAVGGVVGAVALLRGSSARVPVAVAIIAVYAGIALRTGGAQAGEAPQTESEPEREQPVPPPAPARRRDRPVPSGAPALVVEGLCKRFGDRVAVDDVSFSVAAGEVFGFLGPNGAGKTTTVRMLATLIAPTAGTARVAGLPLEPANGVEIRQRIAVMTENPGLYLRLTVAENLEFFAGLDSAPNAGERIRLALEKVNMSGRANDPCGSLSKGLRQRVALARTLLSDPAIVFLDEPTSGLDPVASRDVHELIDDLRDRGVTVFLTTHRLDEAERLCDRVAILNTTLRTIGRPDELRRRLFKNTLVIRTAAPLRDPERVLAIPGVESWHADDAAGYVLAVRDARAVAPELTRALVAAGADVLSLAETRHSLEDVYLELVADDVEVHR
jgi:ABC-2 type transport system ATP-binding protein